MMDVRCSCDVVPQDETSEYEITQLMVAEERDNLVSLYKLSLFNSLSCSCTAKFLVSVRRPGVVALQSVADTRRWLSITGKGLLDGKVRHKEYDYECPCNYYLLITQGGERHPWTELVVKQISGRCRLC